MRRPALALILFVLSAFPVESEDASDPLPAEALQLVGLQNRIQAQLDALAELKAQHGDAGTIARMEQNLEADEALRDQLLREMGEKNRRWSEDLSVREDPSFDIEEARRLFLESEQTNTPAARRTGGFFADPQTGDELMSPDGDAQLWLPGDQPYPMESSGGTGQVPNVTQRHSEAVSQVQTSFFEIDPMVRDIEYINEP